MIALERRFIGCSGRIGDKGFYRQVADKGLKMFGRTEILVNHAGEQHPGKDSVDIREEQLRHTFQTNIFSLFFMVQAVRPHPEEARAIVNCTGVTSYQGVPGKARQRSRPSNAGRPARSAQGRADGPGGTAMARAEFRVSGPMRPYPIGVR